MRIDILTLFPNMFDGFLTESIMKRAIKKEKVNTIHDKEKFLAEIDKIVVKCVDKGVKGIAFCAPGKIAKTEIHFGGALPFLDGVDFAKRYDQNAVYDKYVNLMGNM